MADIVRLADRRARMAERPAEQFVDAKILLFTGVRYERYDRREPSAGQPKSGGPQRAKKR